MKWEITREDTPALIRVRVRGAFDVAKCETIFAEIAKIKGSSAFFPILIDDREADLSGMDHNDMIDLGNLFLKSQSVFAYSKVALLMKPGADIETANRFQRMTAGNSIVTFNIFDDERKAMNWLAG